MVYLLVVDDIEGVIYLIDRLSGTYMQGHGGNAPK